MNCEDIGYIMENITIPEYYANKNIFITGVTGFLGKVLIEKVLRCCPDVMGIYCLIRAKRGLSGQQRLHSMLQEKLYDRLRIEQPDFEKKVHTIEGDCLEKELGIKESDREYLKTCVNVIFHSAATIKFNEHFRLAMDMNVIAVRKMIRLARSFKKLEVFVHVSTAYSNCEKSYIEEVLYPPPMEPSDLIQSFEWMSDDLISDITPNLLKEKPNTYTFTKQLAENLLVQEGSDLPLVIIRPSIITCTWKEPVPGWVDNINGATGIFLAIGKGVLRAYRSSVDSLGDCIPVDYTANLLLASAWYTVVKKPKENAQIYHNTAINPKTWEELSDMAVAVSYRVPFESCFWLPKCPHTTKDWIHRYRMFVLHRVPAYFVDLCLVLTGNKKRMVSICDKIQKATGTLEYFTTRSWKWTHSNADVLKSEMNLEDAETFFLDPSNLDWESYMSSYMIGTKKYVMKEDVTKISTAKAHLNKLKNINYIFNTLIFIVLWRCLVARLKIARLSWEFILKVFSRLLKTLKLNNVISFKHKLNIRK